MKPEALTQLKKGTAIGAPVNMGFTETYNWLVRFCRNLKGDGHWVSVDNPEGDNPTITIGDDLLDEIGSGGECDCDLTPEIEVGTKIATWSKNGVDTDIYAPDGGELTPYLTQGTKIATWSKDGVDTDIYAPNGGGGGEETTLKGNTTDSAKIGPGDLNFKSGTYSNVEVKTSGTDITVSVYYL